MSEFMRTTEQPSKYRHLEKMSVADIVTAINHEDKTVAFAVETALPQITALIQAVSRKMLAGGRLLYLGAGTSGRLGILDASECPPTFGVPYGLVQGIIAGGAAAVTGAVENAEDNIEQGWVDLQAFAVNDKDFVIGIAASGTTPYVIHALRQCRQHNIATGSIACNLGSPLSGAADYPVEVPVGPEFVTGSTRMKSGTAQKMVLNMVSTAAMIQLGRVEDNRMVHMQLSNDKLVQRGTQMVMDQLHLADYGEANRLLLQHGSVKKAVENYKV